MAQARYFPEVLIVSLGALPARPRRCARAAYTPTTFLPPATPTYNVHRCMRYFELLRNRKVLRSFSFDKSTLTVGRGADCDITVESDSVSRSHARIDCHAHGCIIVDLDSTNGVIFEGTRVKAQELTGGQQVGIGKYELRYRGDSNELSVRSAALKNAPDKVAVMPRIEVFENDTLQGKVIIDSGRIAIGKSSRALIKMNGLLAPSIHSYISADDEGCVTLEVLAASPKISVCGVPYGERTRAVLQDRDWISLGPLRLVVRLPTEMTLMSVAMPLPQS